MVLTVGLILAIIALACLIAAAVGVAARVNLLALGLAFWLLSQLVR
jgi:hypothetical protein